MSTILQILKSDEFLELVVKEIELAPVGECARIHHPSEGEQTCDIISYTLGSPLVFGEPDEVEDNVYEVGFQSSGTAVANFGGKEDKEIKGGCSGFMTLTVPKAARKEYDPEEHADTIEFEVDLDSFEAADPSSK